MIQAATEAARSAATMANLLGEVLKSVVPAYAGSHRQDPDATPSTVPIHTPRSQHVPERPQPFPTHAPEVPVTSHHTTESSPEHWRKTMEKRTQPFCKHPRHRHRTKNRLAQALETVQLMKQNPTRDPAWCRPFSSCATWN